MKQHSRPRATRGANRIYRMLRLAAVLLFCVGAVGLRAASTNTVSLDEANAYKAAEQEFGAGLHEQAAKDFETFAAKYPQSERLADALWFGARARFELRRDVLVSVAVRNGATFAALVPRSDDACERAQRP